MTDAYKILDLSIKQKPTARHITNSLNRHHQSTSGSKTPLSINRFTSIPSNSSVPSTVSSIVLTARTNEEDNSSKEKRKRVVTALQFDAYGNKTEKSVTRQELMQQLRIPMRDLRTVDLAAAPFLHVKCIIQWDGVLVFDYRNPEIQSFLALLEQTISGKENAIYNSVSADYEEMPFEHRVLEAVFIDVYQCLYLQYSELKPLIEEQLRMISRAPDAGGHVYSEYLLIYRNRLNQFSKTVSSVHSVLHEIWQSDEDMAAMYLSTRAKTGHRRMVQQHEEIESLLETYLRQIEHMSNEVQQLQQEIVATDEYLNIQLDSVRNKIMRLNVLLSLGSFSTGFSGLTAAVFGMNLPSTLETSTIAFPLVTSGILMGNAAIFLSTYFYLKSKRII
eukprot:CAMPEP_0168571148 /NCGR_PEP_ID=MMETSP0413-20121227/17169_1 /TAXON_ID=136452 /ORGANISM="Filamoeba nolandi, Strain NC-AS-23-1" /LENGTH=389 /DNA_ID=CAMNT_0008603957 /DNA_START=140 /DNA_END=1309 /DNA_ORIENTATION=+